MEFRHLRCFLAVAEVPCPMASRRRTSDPFDLARPWGRVGGPGCSRRLGEMPKGHQRQRQRNMPE